MRLGKCSKNSMFNVCRVSAGDVKNCCREGLSKPEEHAGIRRGMYVLGMYIYIYMYLFIETHRETCIYVHKVTYTSNSSRYFAQQRIIPRGICIYNVPPPKTNRAAELDGRVRSSP